MLSRLQQEAHVWLAEIGASGPRLSLDLLSEAERLRAERIRHVETRAHFVAGRSLLRRVLPLYAPIPSRQWKIAETALGRPEIAGPSQAPALRFNLSHAGGLVVCVVTERIDCGIDIESIDRDVDTLRIAEHSFRAEEFERLEALASADRKRLFFSLWTLKEAYVKARGSGIRLRLDSAGFEIFARGTAQCATIRTRFSDDSEGSHNWQFSLFAPIPRHRLAVALRCETTSAWNVTAWEFDESGQVSERPLPPLGTTGG